MTDSKTSNEERYINWLGLLPLLVCAILLIIGVTSYILDIFDYKITVMFAIAGSIGILMFSSIIYQESA